MEEDVKVTEALQIFCYKLHKKKRRIWMYTVAPSAISFFLYTASLLIDCSVAGQLVWLNQRVKTGVNTFILIYVPVVCTFIFKPPHPPKSSDMIMVASWLLQILGYIMVSPILILKSLLKRLLWTISAVYNKKPYEETLSEYEAMLPKEVHTYLFLQAFLHCASQAILQMHLLVFEVATNKCTEFMQGASVLVALLTVASRTASFHRYEAQVVVGRTTTLLLNPPDNTQHDTSAPLLPIPFCLRGKVIGLEEDCPMGKVVATCSWFLLIFGRLLCLVIAIEIYPKTTIIILFIHFSVMLLYMFSSQYTTVLDIPSRLFNASCSLITLVEVSVRFQKIPLLYTLFFITIFVEDTYFVILIFVYRSYKCSTGSLDCIYTYLIMNSHVIGIMLFGIYLARLRPRRLSLSPSQSSISIVSI